jgi:segregation and condensation protein B
MQKENLIEAILFWRGEPTSLKKLSELSGQSLDETKASIDALEASLQGRGIVLVRKDDEVMLATSSEASEVIERLTKEELSKELSKAALETLSIVIYMSPIRRSEIDYVRGVNSQFSIRHLEIRGLVEKVPDERDNRVYLYRPTFDLLSHLGVSSLDNLPGFQDVKAKLEAFQKQEEDKQTNAEES